MTTTQDQFLGLALLALLVTLGGELLAVTLLVTIGVTSFFLAVVGLFALMTAALIVGVSQRSGPDMYDPVLIDRSHTATLPDDR
ncbi:hypothetical protein ACFQJ5_00425 [Halomicroarcula sp. GCM10025324]|uniref:hypothetical protein n=1 Tax=Haloarcula TaxID=2237 RepID=UPI0023E828B6|nr:hypothetical protein [Halomicroarcula sp. ZS-22-S1]